MIFTLQIFYKYFLNQNLTNFLKIIFLVRDVLMASETQYRDGKLLTNYPLSISIVSILIHRGTCLQGHSSRICTFFRFVHFETMDPKPEAVNLLILIIKIFSATFNDKYIGW